VENGGNGSAYGAGLFLQGNGTLTLAPASGTTLSIADVIADQAGVGASAGVWGVTMNGGGTVLLGAANAYSGGTTIASGQLDITGAGTLGATGGSLTVTGGVLDLGGTTQTQNGGVPLSGGTIQDGTLSSTGTFGLQSGTVIAALTGTGES
jgi:autotransporter-associated beta strand protein